MPTDARGAGARRSRWLGWRGAAAALASAVALCHGLPRAVAASLSDPQLQVIGRAAAFVQPPPVGQAVAIVFNPADPTSRQDADAIAGEIGGGMDIAGVRLPARVVEPGMLAVGHYAIAIAAADAGGPPLGAALQAAHLLCATADVAMVQRGFCTMAVSTDVRVQITLNHAAAAAAGISFAPAFRMMIHEI